VNFPFVAADGTNVGSPPRFAVNGKGAMAWFGGTNRGHSRLYLTVEGQHTLLAYAGTNAAWQTPSPTGSAFESFAEVAIDEGNRIMVIARLRDGSNGLFVYSKGQWRTAALINTTQVDGQTVTRALQLKTMGDKFYAILSVRGRSGGSLLAEFRDESWMPVTGGGDDTPVGNTIFSINSYDINRKGEIAVIASLTGGAPVVLLRSSNDPRLVYINNGGIEAQDQFSNAIWDVQLRDDGRVYFTGLDVSDRYLLYVAELLF
jgi:hypothetical protein